jgi:pilus assembly protein TadC
MTPAVSALALLAAALVAGGGRPGHARLRALVERPGVVAPAPPLRTAWVGVGALAAAALGWTVQGGTTGAAAGALTGVAAGLAARRLAGRTADGSDPADLAGGWELLAVCLQAGLPVPLAVSAAAEPVRGGIGEHLRRVAGLLTLGADPAQAWRGAQEVPVLAAFARAAGRSATTGAALAQVARTEAARLRAELVDTAQARAQRAAVQITAPLGACFLPAFLALGVAPVVLGLASQALARW